MNNKIRRVRRSPSAGVILLGIALWCMGLARGSGEMSPLLAQEPIQVLENAHAVTFGREMRFVLEVESQSPIVSVVLAYRTQDTGGTTVETMSFVPETSLRLEHVHELSRRYVRPFVEVTYWWTIVDATQSRLVTKPQQWVYADDRFDWQTLSGDTINVHWYQGDLKVAKQALDVMEEGLIEAGRFIAPDFPIEPDGAIRLNGKIGRDVYLYAGRDDLLVALPSGSPPDVEAITLHGTNAILVALPPEAAYIPDLRRVLPHEATHVLIHEIAQGAHDRVPVWLSEGLATSVQYSFVPDPEAQTLLQEAVRQDTLIPLLDLCAAFPRDVADARLAYAESANVVGFMQDRYGRTSVHELIDAYMDGATCEGGVYRVHGITLDGLEAQWRASLAPRSGWTVFWQVNGAWAILLLLLAAFPLAFALPQRIRPASLGDKSP